MLCTKAFHHFVRELFMGCRNKADLPRLVKHYIDNMEADQHVIWIKVVESATGRIVACSQWKVFPNVEPRSNGDQPPPWLEGEKRERSAKMMQQFNERRRAANPRGYVRRSSDWFLLELF